MVLSLLNTFKNWKRNTFVTKNEFHKIIFRDENIMQPCLALDHKCLDHVLLPDFFYWNFQFFNHFQYIDKEILILKLSIKIISKNDDVNQIYNVLLQTK